jgi:hypothetical protein
LGKTPFVLQALTLLGFEEMLKLSEIVQGQRLPLKKAAGEELIVWEETPGLTSTAGSQDAGSAKVLPFPSKDGFAPPFPFTPAEEDLSEEDLTQVKVYPSDLLLWQRELSKEASTQVQKLDAFKGYQKLTQIFVVKNQQGQESKEKSRIASTNGILINKKQA